MVLEFIRGMGSQPVAADESKDAIIEHLSMCADNASFINMLNVCYNNTAHFGTLHAPNNVPGFLKELQHAVTSDREVIQIMGDVHMGAEHTSMLIGQRNEQGAFCPARVQDAYISLRIKSNAQGCCAYSALRPDTTYHVLVQPPTLTWVYSSALPVILNHEY